MDYKDSDCYQNILYAARASWPGMTGMERADAIEALLNVVLPDYAGLCGISETDLLEAIENWRTHRRRMDVMNFYQEAHFPALNDPDLKIFADIEAFKASAGADFRCPSCKATVKDLEECSECGWKAYGFFKITRFKVLLIDKLKKGFLAVPIFTPLNWEENENGKLQQK